MAARGRKSVEQIATLSRHDDDKKRFLDFLDAWRCKENKQESSDLTSTCCCIVSTTLNSTVFLLGVSDEPIFSRTSLYSEDIHNPWVITGHLKKLPELANFIRSQWDQVEVPGDQKRVNLIAKHIVYDATDLEKEPQLIPLTCDDEDFVRATIDDITIWSHPPREKPLHLVLAEKHDDKGKGKYDQKIQDMKKYAQNWKELRNTLNNSNPNEVSQRVEESRRKVRDVFIEVYSTYYEQHKLSTIQFEQRIPPNTGIKPTTLATPDDRVKQPSKNTYTDTVNYDNEVHHPFPADGIKRSVQKRNVFNHLGKGFFMTFDEAMETNEQFDVRSRHRIDCDRLKDYLNQRWPIASDSKADDISRCCYSISTSLKSTVLLLSIGSNSMFTRNTYSEDPQNPWLIFSCADQRPGLANFIHTQWYQMTVNGDRGRVNLIAPHIVFDATDPDNPPQRIALECDEKNNVRARVRDVTIWSHPPRDEVLKRVLNNDQKQKLGDVKASTKKWSKISNNNKIPPDIKPQRLEDERRRVRDGFNDLYSSLELPNSYILPTIQLELQIGGGATLRYGDTFAGVYGDCDNEVHQPFPAIGVKPKTKKDVFIHAVVGKEFAMDLLWSLVSI